MKTTEEKLRLTKTLFNIFYFLLFSLKNCLWQGYFFEELFDSVNRKKCSAKNHRKNKISKF